jgi:transposase
LLQLRACTFLFTSAYSSWLNQVELSFPEIERDVIARGVFTSVPDLARKLRRYIRAYYRQRQTYPMEILRSFTPDSS